MVKRVQFGNSSGGYDLLVSKPGIDVTTAIAGNLLLGKNTGVQQIIASGLNQLTAPNASFGGTYTVTLPASVAGLSNLLVWGQLYVDNGGGPNFFYQYYPSSAGDGNFRVVNGSLLIVCNSTLGGGNNYALWAHWAIFRFQYS